MISDGVIFGNIVPQMKILNMFIPVIRHFCSLIWYSSIANCIKLSHHQTKCDVINDVKLFSTVYCRIFCWIFSTLSKQTSHYKLNTLELVFTKHLQTSRKECILENYLHTSHPEHMLWVLKRTVSMRQFFWAPKTHVRIHE